MCDPERWKDQLCTEGALGIGRAGSTRTRVLGNSGVQIEVAVPRMDVAVGFNS